MSETPIDVEAFKGAMGAIASPVSVVTSASGEPHGTTVSAFASLSLEPPMVLISLSVSSELLNVIRLSGRFGLNVLSHNQSDVAMVFARKVNDRFSSVEWDQTTGVPRLGGVAAFVACEVNQFIEAGDHVIVTGTAYAAEHRNVAGLSYQHREFGLFVPQPLEDD